MRLNLDVPQPLAKLRKIYNDKATFITSTKSYPNIEAIEFSGDYLSVMKKRIVPIKVGKKLDRVISKYRSCLVKVWKKRHAEIVKSFKAEMLSELANAVEKGTTLAQVRSAPEQRRTVLYMQYLKERQDELVTPKIEALKSDLKRLAPIAFTAAYILGKNRAQAFTNQEVDDQLSEIDKENLSAKYDWNDEYVDKLGDDSEQNYEDMLNGEYANEAEVLDALDEVQTKEADRLGMFAAAAGSIMLAAGFAQGTRDTQEIDPDTGEPTGEPQIDPDTGIPLGDVVDGGIWHTSHDDSVCDGCEEQDGQWMTTDDFEAEAGNNECLTNCRCIELFEPAEQPPDEGATGDGGDNEQKVTKVAKDGSKDHSNAEKKTLAVDLNGTILDNPSPTSISNFGEPIPGAKEVLSRLKSEGYTIIVHSVWGDRQEIADYLKTYEIPFDHINYNPLQPVGTNVGKPLASAYIDNKGLYFDGNWEATYAELKRRELAKFAKADTQLTRDIERFREIHGEKFSDKFLTEQAQKADKLRDTHLDITDQIARDLREQFPNDEVTSRTKTRYSMVEKLGRKEKYDSVDQIKDVSAVRIVTNKLDDILVDGGIVDQIKKLYDVVEQENYLDHPRNGYRSYHLNVKNADGSLSEIQVRTKNQDDWAMWTYNILYKPKAASVRDYVKEHQTEIQNYAEDVSDALYGIDTGKGAKMPDCPPVVSNEQMCFSPQTLERMMKGDWNEDKHPRDDKGRFGESSGSEGEHVKFDPSQYSAVHLPEGKSNVHELNSAEWSKYKDELMTVEGPGAVGRAITYRTFKLKELEDQKVPVQYVGYQETGIKELPGFHLVDEPSGSTVAYNEDRHTITGHAKPNGKVPDELIHKAWSEELHPRDERGRFGESGAGRPGVTIYHGTTESRVKGILRSGLKAGKYHVFDQEAQVGPGGEAKLRSGKVFVTKNQSTAEMYSEMAVFQSEEKDPIPVVIKAIIPTSYFKENAQKDSEEEEGSYMLDHVKPEWISAVYKEESTTVYIPATQAAYEKIMGEVSKAWTEDLHPRDEHGRFGESGGLSGTTHSETSASPSSTVVMSKAGRAAVDKARADVVAHGKKTGNEMAIIINNDTGDQRQAKGDKNSADIGNIHNDMRTRDYAPDGYTLVHNHPGDASLSAPDVAVLFNFPNINRVEAVGHDGTRYIAERTPTMQTNITRKDIEKEWKELQGVTQAVYQTKYDSDLLNQQRSLRDYFTVKDQVSHDVWKDQSHDIVQQLSERFGFAYYREKS